VMQRGDGADQIKAGRLEPAGKQITDEVANVAGLWMILAALDARTITIDTHDAGDTSTAQLASEITVTAPDVHGPLAAGRYGIKYQRFISGTHRSLIVANLRSTARPLRPHVPNPRRTPHRLAGRRPTWPRRLHRHHQDRPGLQDPFWTSWKGLSVVC